MRRKDRQMSQDFGKELIDRADYGVLSVCTEDSYPLSLPLSIVRDENFLYFHGAAEGEKVESFKKHKKVKVVFVGHVEVPDFLTTEKINRLEKKGKIGSILSNVFTTQFESVIVKGNLAEVTNEKEKIHALKLIVEKYTPSKIQYLDKAIAFSKDRTKVYKIEIVDLTAKRKKYDDQGIALAGDYR